MLRTQVDTRGSKQQAFMDAVPHATKQAMRTWVAGLTTVTGPVHAATPPGELNATLTDAEGFRNAHSLLVGGWSCWDCACQGGLVYSKSVYEIKERCSRIEMRGVRTK